MKLKINTLLEGKNRLFVLAIIISIVSLIPRLYQLNTATVFLGDQGRDALRVARIFRDNDWIFVGPVMSIGNIYLGPAYYYFMLPWLWLSYPSPVGPAVAVAVLSSLTVFLIFLLGKELTNKKVALIASFFYAFNWIAISYSRFSWNPNPAPVVALFLMWALHQAVTKNVRYWVLVSISFALIIQLHYMSLITLLPILLVFSLQVLVVAQRRFKYKFLEKMLFNYIPPFKIFLISILMAIFAWIILMSPLIMFDFRHQGINFNAFQNLISGSDSISQRPDESSLGMPWQILLDAQGRSAYVLSDLFFSEKTVFSFLLVILLLLIFLSKIIFRRELSVGDLIISSFIFSAIFAASLYSHSLYAHYLLFALPAIFLFYGSLIQYVWHMGRINKVLVILFMSLFIYLNFRNYVFEPASHTFTQLKEVSTAIAEHIRPGEKYNIVSLSATRDYYGQNFRYFLDTISTKRPMDPDRDDLRSSPIVVVINEEGLSLADIYSLPIYELSDLDSASIRSRFLINPTMEIIIFDRLQLEK